MKAPSHQEYFETSLVAIVAVSFWKITLNPSVKVVLQGLLSVVGVAGSAWEILNYFFGRPMRGGYNFLVSGGVSPSSPNRLFHLVLYALFFVGIFYYQLNGSPAASGALHKP